MGAPKYIQGDTNPVTLTVALAQAVAIKDLIALIANTAVRAQDVAWTTDLPTTQAALVTGFVGVSMQQKDAGKARVFGNSSDLVLVVATGGIWEFDCAAATFNPGDLFGAAKDTGNALLSQQVVAVASEADAIGRCVLAGTNATRVRLQILSKLIPFARQT